MGDAKKADFTASLIPNLPRDRVLGIASPELKRFARGVTAEAREAFLADLPHFYLEEDLLHALFLGKERDFDAALGKVEAFLPHVTNWAVCDSLNPKAFGRERERLLPEIRRWLDSTAPYTVRFGLSMLMRYFLDEAFRPEYLDWAAAVESEEYYVRMMVAWYFATALAKQPEATLPYIEDRRLPRWTHNKAIQKAVESYRVPAETKVCLKTLRWKE